MGNSFKIAQFFLFKVKIRVRFTTTFINKSIHAWHLVYMRILTCRCRFYLVVEPCHKVLPLSLLLILQNHQSECLFLSHLLLKVHCLLPLKGGLLFQLIDH